MAIVVLVGAALSFTLPLGAEADHGHDHGDAATVTATTSTSTPTRAARDERQPRVHPVAARGDHRRRRRGIRCRAR